MAAANNESPMNKVSKDTEQEANTGRDAVKWRAEHNGGV